MGKEIVTCVTFTYTHTGWDKDRFAVVCMERDTIISNNTRINCFKAYNCKPFCPTLCIHTIQL